MPQTVRASNPFCKASAFVTPWNVGADAPLDSSEDADYGLWLFADGKTDAAARVTLITDTDAYSVNLPRLSVHVGKDGGDAVSDPFLVRFDRAVTVRYAFVDGAGVDGAEIGDCPTYVQSVDPYRDKDAPRIVHAALTLKPTYLQALPKLACGKTYQPASIRKQPYTQWTSHYGDKPLEAVVKVYLDSNGTFLKEELYRSSGVDGFDQTVLSDARMNVYAPATFLCSPVVSTYYFAEDYRSG